MANKAVLAGASGLIGSALLNILLENSGYDEVILLVRNEIPINHPKLTQIKVNFFELDDYSAYLNGQSMFCCLGTTRKKTPNLEEYRKIDHDYPVKLAEIGHKNGIKQFHLVSSLGANPKASNYYLKFKGETEEDIVKSGIPTIHIYQPSLLTGERKEKRMGEGVFFAIMKVIDPLLFGSLKKYRSIPALTVAWAMYKQSLIKQEGVFIHPSDKIKELS